MPRQVTRRFRGTTVIDNLRLKNVRGGPFDEIGRVYHINTEGAVYAGDDANSGLEYEHPLATITEALSRCVAGRNDYILIHDYWRPTGETWPIVPDKKQVHIMGVAQAGLPYPAIHPEDDVPAFVLGSSGQYGEIAYLTIGGGGSFGGINIEHYTGGDMEGQVDGFWIHHNTFGHVWFGTPECGIQKLNSSIHPSHGVVIEENEFLGDLASGKGAIKGNAIDILGTTDGKAIKNWTIRWNRFKGCYIGVNLVRAYDPEVTENYFVIADAVTGEAITLAANCTGAMVIDNKAINGMLNAGYTHNPFRDLSAHPANHWGMNYRGNQVIEPVGV